MRLFRVFLSILLLALFATYQVSITMFTHVHYVNGVMIVHSHPNKGKHTHAKTELVIIDRLSAFQTLVADEVVYIKPKYKLIYSLEILTIMPIIKQDHLQVLSLRAPPAIVI